MQEQTNQYSIEIKSSKTNLCVPVINGIHLHSIYDPLKEAENMANQNFASYENKSNILILGLGMGHHVLAIYNQAILKHPQCEIVVLEPLKELEHLCKENNTEIINDKITILAGYSCDELYRNKFIIDYLLLKPAIIFHAPSFNMHKKYFTDFLKYNAPTRINQLISYFDNEEIKDYFTKISNELSISDYISKSLPTKNKFEKLDFLMMAYQEIKKEKTTINQG